MGRLSEARRREIEKMLDCGPTSPWVLVARELLDGYEAQDAEPLRLRRIILEDAGCFTREQIAALLAPEGERAK